MNRKILALNLALALLAIYAGFRLQQEYAAKKARDREAALARFQPAPPIPFGSQPVPPPVLAATYSTIANKLLLDRSRNPDVVIPPPPPPPAPKPIVVPPLPGFHGEMNLDGPVALLSTGNSGPQAIHPGEMIGPFRLIDVTKTDIVFEWDGQLIKKSVDEILVKSAAPQVAANNSGPAAPPMAAPTPPPVQKPLGPGPTNQFGVSPCQPNDSTPEGTIQNGLRKTLRPTPFGSACVWEPVGGSGK